MPHISRFPLIHPILLIDFCIGGGGGGLLFSQGRWEEGGGEGGGGGAWHASWLTWHQQPARD